jgi:hypothetical protein
MRVEFGGGMHSVGDLLRARVRWMQRKREMGSGTYVVDLNVFVCIWIIPCTCLLAV